MTVLLNFPMVSERTVVTGDSHPSENSGLDCVPASICAGAMWLNHIPQLGGQYTPDSFKDAVYGQGTVGGEGISPYVNFCQSIGIKLFSLQGNGTDLVQLAHQQLQAGHPVVFVEPNPYGNPNYTHVCIFFGEDAGTLTSMDPWIAQAITRKDAEWASILLGNELWSMEKIPMQLPSNWHLSPDGQTLYCKNIDPHKPDVPVVFGFKDFVLPLLHSGQWLNEDVFLGPQEYKEQLEYSDPDLGDGDQIVSLFGRMLCYPHNPKGAVAHLKNAVVLEYTGVELNRWRDQFLKLLALYQADEEKLKQQPANTSPDLVQRLALISGLVQQAGPILQQIGTAATVK